MGNSRTTCIYYHALRVVMHRCRFLFMIGVGGESCPMHIGAKRPTKGGRGGETGHTPPPTLGTFYKVYILEYFKIDFMKIILQPSKTKAA